MYIKTIEFLKLNTIKNNNDNKYSNYLHISYINKT